jgi:hypothetical protein
MGLLGKMGFITKIDPQKRDYNYIFLNGYRIPNMRNCLETLISIVEEGLIDLTKTKLVMLTGEQILFKAKDGSPWEQEELFQLPSESIHPGWISLQTPPKTEDQALK